MTILSRHNNLVAVVDCHLPYFAIIYLIYFYYLHNNKPFAIIKYTKIKRIWNLYLLHKIIALHVIQFMVYNIRVYVNPRYKIEQNALS